MALRCGWPLGARGPERSGSAVTLRVLGSCVGAGVATAGSGALVHPAKSSTRDASQARGMRLRARAVGERLAFRVHVSRGVLGARVGLALGLRDRRFDL